MRKPFALVIGLSLIAPIATASPPSRSLSYLDDPTNPYYVHRDFPKLTTPMWVGEPGVEAVVILAIDDMNEDTAPYEAYLRPILDRLKAIDGRAPVSIMTCRVDPANEQLPKWLKEGVSFECHTRAHPCPLLQKGDFRAAAETYHSCIDAVAKVPNNAPVAFRMPCCDSMNSVSPRFFAELFNRPTPEGRFLQADSSVFHVFTPADRDLPRDLVLDPDGAERFRKYVSFPSFVNTIEDYPYPYVIGGRGWEFPCMAPSDWEGQNRHGKAHPKMLEDMKAALDLTVAKQGVMAMVFHPYGWMSPAQMVELIDHSAAKHGPKVKFLTFPEALERLNRNVLGGASLRVPAGGDAGVRLLDLDADGYLDAVIANDAMQRTRRWDPAAGRWAEGPFPLRIARWADPIGPAAPIDGGVRFGRVRGSGASVLAPGAGRRAAYTYRDGAWAADDLLRGLEAEAEVGRDGLDFGARLRDLDGDGLDELLIANPEVNHAYHWDEADRRWTPLSFGMPGRARIAGVSYTLDDGTPHRSADADAGTRFVDLDGDGHDDIIGSNPGYFGAWLFDSMETGWSRQVMEGTRTPAQSLERGAALPPITRTEAGGATGADSSNGFWVHSGHLWWQNEDTADLPQHVDRRRIADLIREAPTRARSVEEALRSFRVRPGFRLEVVAAEPLIADPVAFDVGADGRLWVVEMGDYPLGGDDGPGSPGGRVRVLEDSDGDGCYDRSTLFLDGLHYPNGIACWRDGVIISAAPDVFFAADADGDGKADRRETLLSGFDEQNPQHRVNGFALGLDGWLHGADGTSHAGVLSTRTGKRHPIAGRDFRFRPDTGEFALSSGRGQFGRQRDDWGNWFNNDNSTWARHVVIDDAALARNPSLAVPVPAVNLEPDRRLFPASPIVARFNDLDNAGLATSANSPAPYRDDLLGPGFADSLFVSEPVHNVVHRLNLTPDGATYRGVRPEDEKEREFLASSDPWFRPAMVRTGPDGGLWIADMYRAVIEHPEWIPDDWEARLDLRAGHDKGRIYRVVSVDRDARPFARLDRLDAAALVAAMDSPNGWRRDTAMRLLLERNATDAAGALRKLETAAERPAVRLQALATLDLLGRLDANTLRAALADAHREVRRWASERAGRMAAADPDLGAALLRNAADPEPRVRFGAALGLGDWNDPAAARALAELLARDGGDPWIRTAALSSARPHAAEILANWLRGGPDQPLPAGVLDPMWNTLLADRSSAGRAGAILERLLGQGGPPAGRVGPVAGLLEAMARHGRPLDEVLDAIDEPRRDAARRRLADLANAAEQTARDGEAPAPDRLAALRLLGRPEIAPPGTARNLADLLDPSQPAPIRRAALRAIAALRDDQTPAIVLAGWKSHTPELRREIVEVLLARADWAGALVEAVASGTPARSELGAAALGRLMRHENPELRRRAEAVLGAPAPQREKVIAGYRAKLPAAGAGDATAGRAAFQRVCATCHELGGVGHPVGPDLRSLTDRSPEAMLIALFDPNRAVEPAYGEYAIALRDGRVLNGLIAGETANGVTLRRPDAQQDVLARSEIDAIQATGKSLMPEGLEENLTARDVADLLAFLDATLPPAKSIEGNRPAVVAADERGGVTLAADSAEIRGPSLTFETQYRNLGFWTSPADNATWTFELPRGGTFAVSAEYACPADAAGGVLALQVGGERLTWTVPATAGWDDYQTRTVGTITLPAGRHRLVARSDGPPKSALLDLRAIPLTPR